MECRQLEEARTRLRQQLAEVKVRIEAERRQAREAGRQEGLSAGRQEAQSELTEMRQVVREEARREGLALGRQEVAEQLEEWRDRVQGILERAKAYLRPLQVFLRDELAPQSKLFAAARRMWSPGVDLAKGLRDLTEALDREANGYRAGRLGEMQKAQDAPLLAAHRRALVGDDQADTLAPPRAQPALDESRPGF